MNDQLTQLGLGGLVAYLVIKEVLNFLSKRKNGRAENGASGEKSTSYWRETIREIIEQAIKDSMSKRNEDIRNILREELRGRR